MSERSEPATVLDFVTERLMEYYGYSRHDGRNEREWEADNPDSQYAMSKETAEVAINALEEALTLVERVPARIFRRSAPFQTAEPSTSPRGPVRRFMTTYLSVEPTDDRKSVTVGDVRDWLDEVDSLGVPDDFSIEGSLTLMYDEAPTSLEPSTCGECGSEEDVIVRHHFCDPKKREW